MRAHVLRFLTMLFVLVSALASAEQILPNWVGGGEGAYVSGTLASLRANDDDYYVKTTVPDEEGRPTASFAVSFEIPADAPSALLRAETSVPLSGAIAQLYIYDPSLMEFVAYAQMPVNYGQVEFAVPGDQLSRFRDPLTAQTYFALRMFRPAAGSPASITWKTNRVMILTPVLPGSVVVREGVLQYGSVASLRAADDDPYGVNAVNDGGNNRVASFDCAYEIPYASPSAVLHVKTKAAAPSFQVAAYLVNSQGQNPTLAGYGTLSPGGELNFSLSDTQLAQYRNAATGKVWIRLRAVRFASQNPIDFTWETDQAVVYVDPFPGPTNGDVYAQAVDLREFSGGGFGGETAHVVRLDFAFSAPPSTVGGSSTANRAASVSAKAVKGSPAANRVTVPVGAKRYRLKPRAWMLRRGKGSGSGQGVPRRATVSDFLDQPPAALLRSAKDAASTKAPPAFVPSAAKSSASARSTMSASGTESSIDEWYIGVDAQYASAFTRNGLHPTPAVFVTPAFVGNRLSNIVAYPKTSASDRFEYRLPGAAARTVYVVHYYQATSYNPSTDTWSTYHSLECWPSRIQLTRRNAPTVAIDSRKVYGQPNLDGAVPGDANADLRNPSFYNWEYKGGLFVGNAPASSNDQSGTARIQAYAPTGNFLYPLLSSYTLVNMGHPSRPDFQSPVPFSLFVPSASDPNLGTSATTATWANRWDLASATVGAGDEAFLSVPVGEYTRVLVPEGASRFGLALQNESAVVGGGGAFWQYFASAAYPQFADPAPRVWTADLISTSGGWYVLW